MLVKCTKMSLVKIANLTTHIANIAPLIQIRKQKLRHVNNLAYFRIAYFIKLLNLHQIRLQSA